MQHELLDGRTLPTLDHPTRGQERNSLSQMDADFKVLCILPCMNWLWQISLLILLGSGSHYSISSLRALLAGSDLKRGKWVARAYMGWPIKK